MEADDEVTEAEYLDGNDDGPELIDDCFEDEGKSVSVQRREYMNKHGLIRTKKGTLEAP
jgi:hypothetical protein